MHDKLQLLDRLTSTLRNSTAHTLDTAKAKTLHYVPAITTNTALLWTLSYIFLLGLMYLFHSPFRVHSGSRTDWYAQVTKVLQIWFMVVLVCFHLGPVFLQQKETVVAAASSATASSAAASAVVELNPADSIATVFFPIFTVAGLLFQLLHKLKRRLQLGVTYGPSFTLMLLNSLLLATLSTMHYAYCLELLSHPRWRWVRLGRAALFCPSRVTEHPFWSIARLWAWNVLFVLLDYAYKKRCGFDPARGILWSDVYDARPPGRFADGEASTEAPSPLALAKTTGGPDDVRYLLEPKPARIHTGKPPASPSPSSSPSPPPQGGTGYAGGVSSLMGGGQPQSSPRWHGTASFGEAGLGHQRSHHPQRTTMTVATTAPSAGTPVVPSVGPVAALPQKCDFAISADALRSLKAAQHPVNRPGMVPWFSTFVVGTTWQTASRAALDFLTFDVRALQHLSTPKIFDLHFAPTLEECRSSFAAPAASPPHMGSGSLGMSSGPGHTASGVLSEDFNTCASFTAFTTATTSATGLGAASATEPDVWFDWLADVGDGFNSTYEMARLLAKPLLQVPFVDDPRQVKSRRARKATLSGGARTTVRRGGDGGKEGTAQRLHPLLLDRVGRLIHRPRRSKSGGAVQTLTSPATGSCSSTFTGGMRSAMTATFHLRSPSGREACTAPPRVPAATSVEPLPPLSPLQESAAHAGGEGGSVTRTSPSFANVVELSSRSDPVSGAAGVAALRSPRGGAEHTFQVPRSARTAEFGGEIPHIGKDGMATLPRGSFVVVGGDLAYPNPCDETFQTRLLSPYRDALSGHATLQALLRSHRGRIVERDEENKDLAHIHLLDANTVSTIAQGGSQLRSTRGIVEEALRSLPLFFAIPGNHEWFDGLSTFTKYIIEESWMGGWLMPQRSSFFVLKLPHNWFMLCVDNGTNGDMDVAQRNYFLNVIDQHMDDESCVILCCHEPGWIYDAMVHRKELMQPELSRLAQALGTRLRLRIAGDIHHYSRHTPSDPLSDAPTLIVSGGGGAFMHGSRTSKVISQGTEYVRAAAFPARNTYMSIASRLVGFRLINWKFDLIVGIGCALLIESLLPQPFLTTETVEMGGIGQTMVAWASLTLRFVVHIFSKGVVSIGAVLFFFACFSAAGGDRDAPLWARVAYGSVWTLLVLLTCCGMLAYVDCLLAYLAHHGMLVSTAGKWGSLLENQLRASTDTLLRHTQDLLGATSAVSMWIGAMQRYMYDSAVVRGVGFVLRCLDPVETLAYLSMSVSGDTLGSFAPEVGRLEMLLYYYHVSLIYWVLVTPLVSFLIGSYLFVSVTAFDCMYDAAYSAFQIEDYKHFIRFKIDHATRELHGYVVAEKTVPKVWKLDPRHVDEQVQPSSRTLPPHLQQRPSRWMASQHQPGQSTSQRRVGVPVVLEHFVCRPHRLGGGEINERASPLIGSSPLSGSMPVATASRPEQGGTTTATAHKHEHVE